MSNPSATLAEPLVHKTRTARLRWATVCSLLLGFGCAVVWNVAQREAIQGPSVAMAASWRGLQPRAQHFIQPVKLSAPRSESVSNQLPRLPEQYVPMRFTPVAMAARKFFVGGNWKANGSPESVKELVEGLNAGQLTVDPSKDVEVICAPPAVYLSEVKKSLRPDYSVSAQNMWDKAPGAWTGEIPGEMLVSMGIGWTILGHSERRESCGETSQVVADKTKFAIEKGLKAITCIGEKLDARESGKTFEVLDEQMRPLATALQASDWDKVVLAYEPVWAIGTGKVATPEQAEETHAFLRKWLKEHVSEEVSDSLRILYGGSVNDKNSEELAKQPNIDGFLVGGASLQGGAFTTIINSAKASVPA